MLRWLSFFGALALVISGVVFYLYKGPPESPFSVPQPGVQRRDADPAGPKPDLAGPKNVHAEPAQPAAPSQQGPWQGVMAITPRAAIPRARLEALQSPQVPALHEGQLLFLGTEVKPGEPVPPDAFRQEVAYLVTEVQPGDTVSPDDLEKIDGKSYRPLGKREPVVPYRVKLVFKEKAFRPVDEGTVVEKGQLLALIDPVTAVDELASRLAKFDAAESDRIASEKIRDFYKAQYDTRVELWRKGSATREEVNEAKAGWDRYTQETISKGEAVKVAARELRQAETVLGLHQIRSRVSGVVRGVYKHPGEGVKALEAVVQVRLEDK